MKFNRQNVLLVGSFILSQTLFGGQASSEISKLNKRLDSLEKDLKELKGKVNSNEIDLKNLDESFWELKEALKKALKF